MLITKSHPESISLAVSFLLKEEAVILPTDTVYGFSGIVPAADRRIREIKGRCETKPFIRLVADPADIHLYSSMPIPEWLLKYWPGPLTVIVPLIPQAVDDTKTQTAAFRCPGDEWLRCVIRSCGYPLYSTSVNRSGTPILYSIDSIMREFEHDVSLIVDDGDSIPGQLPSTIVDISQGAARIVRQGTLCLKEIEMI